MDAFKKKQLLMCIAIADDESSSSDDDEENKTLINNINEDKFQELLLLKTLLPSSRNMRTCIKGYCEQVVRSYNEKEFITHFRLNRELYTNLCQRFEESEVFQDLREDKRIEASKYLLIFLWFAGHEACSYRDIADRFDISLSSVNRIITRVIKFMNTLADDVICWPNDAKKEETANFFSMKYGFPNVLGAIDGTHIIIDPPKNKDDYIDRKGNGQCTIAECLSTLFYLQS